ncbi:MAG TPA: hypothetical protein VNZ64_11035 [Candidatus Acidoferrum sp.]|nr:hypothetical protein [Candidatus Acidoferrum sp.]
MDARPVGDLWDALELDAPRGDDADFRPPPDVAGFTPNATPTDSMPMAFADGAAKATAPAHADAKQKLPELFIHFENL